VRFLDSDTDAHAAVPDCRPSAEECRSGCWSWSRFCSTGWRCTAVNASSDLFAFENFAAVAADAAGAATCRDELPVYETTRTALQDVLQDFNQFGSFCFFQKKSEIHR